MRLNETLRRIRSTDLGGFGNVPSFSLDEPRSTSMRIKDGLLRFDMPNDSSYKVPARLRMGWSGNPHEPVVSVHYITDEPFEGVVLRSRKHLIGRECTRFAMLASPNTTLAMAGSASEGAIEYVSLNQIVENGMNEITENMDIVVSHWLTRLDSQIRSVRG